VELYLIQNHTKTSPTERQTSKMPTSSAANTGKLGQRFYLAFVSRLGTGKVVPKLSFEQIPDLYSASTHLYIPVTVCMCRLKVVLALKPEFIRCKRSIFIMSVAIENPWDKKNTSKEV